MLVALEIQVDLNMARDDEELMTLIHAKASMGEWDRVKSRYHEMIAD